MPVNFPENIFNLIKILKKPLPALKLNFNNIKVKYVKCITKHLTDRDIFQNETSLLL